MKLLLDLALEAKLPSPSGMTPVHWEQHQQEHKTAYFSIVLFKTTGINEHPINGVSCGDANMIQTETLCPESPLTDEKDMVTWLLVSGDTPFGIHSGWSIGVTLHWPVVFNADSPFCLRPLVQVWSKTGLTLNL